MFHHLAREGVALGKDEQRLPLHARRGRSAEHLFEKRHRLFRIEVLQRVNRQDLHVIIGLTLGADLLSGRGADFDFERLGLLDLPAVWMLFGELGNRRERFGALPGPVLRECLPVERGVGAGALNFDDAIELRDGAVVAPFVHG
jgi:hypothetical protein